MTETSVSIGRKVAAPTTFDEAMDRLESVLPGFERREHQTTFAHAVEEVLADGTHLVAQGGCGVGKSFALAIPAILSGKKVVLATATKALQDQIAHKDLPFLQEHLGVDFTFAVLKGRSNYACHLKLADPDVIQEIGVDFDAIIEDLQAEDATGERDSLSVEVADRTWRSMTISSDDCLGKNECPFAETCLAEKAKTKAKAADVVVVNHALLMVDLVIREMSEGTVSMLPDYDLVIIDECHELENYATTILGTQFSEGTVRSLTGEVLAFARRYGKVDEVDEFVNATLGALTALWPRLPDGRITMSDLNEASDEWVGMANSLHDLAAAIASIDLDDVSADQIKQARLQWRRLTKRSHNAQSKFADIVVASFAKLVRWVEVTKRGREEVRVIHSAPIEIGEMLDALLFSKTQVIMASATVMVDGSPEHIAGRLGVTDYRSVDVGTPFDFSTQAMLYIPRHLPDPSKDRAAWSNMIIPEIRDLVRASDGRALLLFTSTKEMRSAYETLSEMLPYTCLMQGQATNKVLVDTFKADTHSVLFATRSFFTGVDIPGEALSLLVVDKVPFAVPSDPIVEARCDAIQARGGNPFTEFSIPEMILPLEQGVGRLIRHTTDIGVMAILDPRIMTKPYGRKIRRSLPEAPLVHTIADVEAFFDRVGAAA